MLTVSNRKIFWFPDMDLNESAEVDELCSLNNYQVDRIYLSYSYTITFFTVV